MDPLRVLNETHGFFTRTEALAAGHDDRSIRRALGSRSWRRIRPGTYCYPDLWPPDAEALHLARARSFARKAGPRVALSHVSAALDLGLRVWDADLSVVHVTRLDAGAGRTEAGVAHHEGLVVPGDLVARDNRLVTCPARAAIETSSLLSSEAGLVTLDSALQLGLCTEEELAATYASMRSWPGLQRLNVTLQLSDAGSQSVGESRARYLCYAHGLPAPVLQYEVRDLDGRLVGITDFAWPEHRLLGEFDGRVKYGRLLRDSEDPGEVVFREKRREDELRRVTGFAMVRMVWADLHQPFETAARIRSMLRAAA